MFDIELEIDENFKNLIKNKRIAIIGPSPHLIDKKIGDIIDSYDIVCRINEVSPIGFEKDYGSRTDIIFHNCNSNSINNFSNKLNELEKVHYNLKYVVCPCVKAIGSDIWHEWGNNFLSPVVMNFNKINKYNIPFFWIGINNYHKIYNLFNCEPNAGQTALLLLLMCDIKELFVTGFSFYSQGDMPYESHRPGHTYKDIAHEAVGNLGHKQEPQKACFKERIFPFFKEKIILDSFLNNLLLLNHNRVLTLE